MDMLRQYRQKLAPPANGDAAATEAVNGTSGPLSRWAPRRPDPDNQSNDDERLPLFDHRSMELDAVIISDIHLGCENCQAKLLSTFLEGMLSGKLKSRRLIINGDVFDSIDFRRLKKTHWKVLSMIRHLSDKIEVIWTCGNHDGPAEIVSHLLGVEVHDEYTFVSGERNFLVMHGHVFDDFIDDHPIMTWFGDLLYNTLQKLDRRHYVARLAKARSKIFLHCVEKVKDKSIAQAHRRQCDVVICGHTHQSGSANEQGVEYFNSGCWTELPATWLAVRNGAVRLCKFHAASLTVDSQPKKADAVAT
ncbi:MAG TPA: UDP-2,3-diacylglucosamine diphosphatase [Phycisphaerae bacterium]|nr:UDP-2,3-diacylglucosamine diphosphatase [Phycisphaerae bacterium]